MSGEFTEVYYHRLKYFLTPQLDMYRIIREKLLRVEIVPGFTTDNLINGACSILDYGCGNGVGSLMLKSSDWKIVGIDSDEAAISFARECWGHIVEFKHDDWAAAIDEDSDAHRYRWRYDVVVSLEVIEHVDNPQAMLKVLRNSCLPGALVFISTLNHNSQYRKNPGHVGKFHVTDFLALVGQFFPGARLYNYDLTEELDDESTLTPMVAVWKEGAE